MRILFPLMLLLPLSAFAGETVLQDDILKVGECELDDLKSGRKNIASSIYWMVYDDRNILIGTEMPSHEYDTIRFNTPDRRYVQMGSSGKEVFHSVYRFKVDHKIKKEVFERNWLFQKKEGTEKIVVENTSEYEEFKGQADVKKRDEPSLRAQKNIADFTAKQYCETGRAEYLAKLAKSQNVAVDDSDRGNNKADLEKSSGASKKPASATKQ